MRSIQKVRDTVETRISLAILGTEVPSAWQSGAFKCIRTGALGDIRLLHLLNEKDSSTTQDPLGGFSSFEKQGEFHLCAKLRQTQTLLQRAIMHSNILLGMQAIEFFSALFDAITEGINLGVKLSDASEFWRATVAKAQRPAVALRLGVADGRGAAYDVATVKQHSDARTKFDRAVSSAFAVVNARQNKVKQPREPRDTDKPKTAAEKRKAAKEKEEQKKLAKGTGQKPTRKEAIAKFNKGKGTNADGVDATAAAVPIGPNLAQFHTNCPPCDMGDGFTVKQCFDYCHPQGCTRGESCGFAHKKN